MNNEIGVGVHDFRHEQYGDLIRSKVEAQIEKGKASVAEGLGSIMNEFRTREDLVVRPRNLIFRVDAENRIVPTINGGGLFKQFSTTPYSLRQVYDRTGVPMMYGEKLLRHGMTGLLEDNLDSMLDRVTPEGVLIRHVNGMIKGFLTTSYRRMDAGPIFEMFAGECVRMGLVPYRASNTDSRYAITFVYPRVAVIDESGGRPEVVMFGVQMLTSDYGASRLVLQIVILRVWCANLASGMDLISKIHLGRRFEIGEGDETVILSQQTIDLDTAAVASAIRDVMATSEEKIVAARRVIEDAVGTEANVEKVLSGLRKKGYMSETIKKIRELHESRAMPVEVLPPGNSLWRLSNVLSFLANDASGDSQLDLQRDAFDVLAAA